ncbi:hypothetical protein LSAT2_026034 [Lamellibrachia satsuma]|nr:hypothetical protein LSAT2_026034 [Lamellibrachia satsuma]
MDGISQSYTPSSATKNPRWTDEEWSALVELIEEERSILYGSNDAIKGEDGKCMKVRRVTFAQKQQCWERIQQKLASLGISPQERSAKEIKKRKECMFSKIKKKAADLADSLQQPTAGGDGGRLGDLTSLEMRVVTIMGQASVEDLSDVDRENHLETGHRPSIPTFSIVDPLSPPTKRKKVNATHETHPVEVHPAEAHRTSTSENGLTLLDSYSRLAKATEEQTYLLRQLVEIQQQRLAIDAKQLAYLELSHSTPSSSLPLEHKAPYLELGKGNYN